MDTYIRIRFGSIDRGLYSTRDHLETSALW